MKKVLLFVALVLSCAMYGFAQQDNEKISYQAVVRDSENHLVHNRNLSVTVAIANSANARAVFTERHEDVKSNANGLISLLIGNGNRLSGRWEDIQWNTAVVTATIVDASTTETLAVHVLPLQAVPYALYANYADSTNMQPIRNELADTAAAIRNTISATANDGKLTIRRNGQDLGIFTADQAGNTDVDILVPEKISDLVNDSRFADTTADNHFTGDNRFTGHNAVTERGFYLDGNNPTTASNCQVMVNACDLLALFDSMQNRINGVKDSLNGRIDSLLGVLNDIMNSVPPTFNSLTVGDITTESIKATATFTAAGAPISSYQFCISKNADMSNPVGCYTSDANVYTFTGLNPYTIYYITASGTNLAGTANSDVVSGRTLTHAPTAAITVGQHKPTGFVVNIGSLNFQEAANGTVQICYKQKEGNDCPVDATKVYADYTNCKTKENVASSTDIAEIISENIDDLDKDHCVIVKVSNEDSTTVYGPFSVTPSDITLTVTGTESVTYQCGIADVTPSYTATLSAGENADDYTFVWTYGNKKDTVGTTYTPALTESTTVTCTATHNTENFSLSGSVDVTVVNQGTVPVIALCVNNLTVTDKGSTNIAFVKWDDNDDFESATTVGYDYDEAGVHTITAKSADGCTATRTVAVSEVTLHPCTVLDSHPAQLDVVGGVEETDGTGKIISVSDKDENTYSVVQIGNQCWMAENLRATQYSDGTAIPLGSTTASSTAAYRYYPNGVQSNVDEYGYLYNWQAATRGQSSNSNSGKGVQGACPKGWHIPTDAELSAMEEVVNGGPVIYPANMVTYGGTHGGKLATGCAWKDTTVAQVPGNYTFAERNASGFGALPAGRFTGYNTGSNNGYYNITSGAEFWSCTYTSTYGDDAWHRALRFDDPGMSRNEIPIEYAFSVRCMRDTVMPSTLSVTPSSTSVSYCVNGSGEVSYQAAVNQGNSNITYTYSWSVSPAEGASLSSTTGTTVTVTYNATTSATDYTVSCTATPTTGSALTETATTSVSNLPTPTFEVNTEDLAVTLVNYNNIDKIKWTANDNEVDFTTPTYTYDAPGTYTITARNTTSNCSKSEVVTVGTSIVVDLKSSCVTQNGQVVSSVPSSFSSETAWTSTTVREKGREMTSGGQTYIVIDSVSDYENGHWYKVVQIGSQCWMKENMRATKYGYNTTNTLTLVTASSSEDNTERNFYYPGDNATNEATKGLLYNWKAATNDTSETMNSNVRGICPAGWHVPSDGEWYALETKVNQIVNNSTFSWTSYDTYDQYIGSDANCLGRALSEGNWFSSYCDEASNFSGFSARPAGYKWGSNVAGNYCYSDTQAHFWTSSVYTSDATKSYTHQLRASNMIYRQKSLKTTGRSVRCVRNAE